MCDKPDSEIKELQLDPLYLTATPEEIYIFGFEWLHRQNKIFERIYNNGERRGEELSKMR